MSQTATKFDYSVNFILLDHLSLLLLPLFLPLLLLARAVHQPLPVPKRCTQIFTNKVSIISAQSIHAQPTAMHYSLRGLGCGGGDWLADGHQEQGDGDHLQGHLHYGCALVRLPM